MHNPDVLNCLANLSSDEVFTPPSVVNDVLNLLPITLFQDAKTRFLDPACKSGVFLREIAKRLNDGLKGTIKDDQERIDHILTKQLFGIALTELTAMVSRRTLYGSKAADGKNSFCNQFDDPFGNIRFTRLQHAWSAQGKCEYCGASSKELKRGDDDESHAYELIHTKNPQDIFQMRFDVIVGNPPYQLNDGGGTGSSARPIYHQFIEQAKKLDPRFLSMIVPSRWFSGGKGLDQFRETMLGDRAISNLVDFADSRECFPNVDIAGGVNYFIWDREHQGKCQFTHVRNGKRDVSHRYLDQYPTLIRDSTTLSIVRKVQEKWQRASLSEKVSARLPFGIPSKARPVKQTESGSQYVEVVTSGGTGPIARSSVTRGAELIGQWKTFLSKASSDHAGQASKSGERKVFARTIVANPGLVCSESYLVVNPCDSEAEAKNTAAYLQTKFVRFLVAASLFTQNITRDRFAVVPLVCLKEVWDDPKLYAAAELSTDEIEFIESTIKSWEGV